MKKTRRSLMIAVSLIIVVLFFLLPPFLCQRPVLHSILNFINRQVPGTLEVQSCSLGWWQGISCVGLNYQEPTLGIRMSAPKLTGDKGLFVLLVAPQYLGEITIDQPTLTFLPCAKAVADPSGHQTVHKTQEAAARTPWWERVTFRLKLHKGLVVRDQGQSTKQELAREIDLTGSLAGGSINYALAFRSGLEQQEGYLRAEGFINLPTARQSLLDVLISRTEVEIKGLEIAAFLDLAASRGNFPKGKGVLDATCHVLTAGIDDLELHGETSLRGLHLSGGFLGQDQPAIERLLFTFKGSHHGREGWQLANLHFESDPVRVEANGRYDSTTASLAAKGSVNLAVVASQLPHLLSLHEKTTIKKGLVDFALNVSGTPQDFSVKANCLTGSLDVAHNGQLFSWDTPLSLVVEADRRQGKTLVRTLQAHTPFLDAQASGEADNFSIRATADLGRMFDKMDKLFALNLHGKGTMELTGSSKQQDDGRYRLDTRIGSNDLALSRDGATFLPAHDFLLTGEAWTSPSLFQQGLFTALQINGDFWPGNFSFFAQNSEQKTGKMPLSCSTNGVIDLARMTNFLYGLTGSFPPCKWGGIFSFEGSGIWDKNYISLETLNGKIDRLAVTGPGYSHQERQLTVSLANKAPDGAHPLMVRELMVADNWQDFFEREHPILLVDFRRRFLALHHLTIEAAGTAAQGSLSLGNWRQPRNDFAAEVSGTSKASLLTTLMKAAGWSSADMAMQGRAQATLKARSSGEQKVLTELAVQIEPFELLRAHKRVFEDRRLFLKATLLEGNDEVAIPAFALQTTPLRVEGTGLVQQGVPASLELQGSVTPNLSFFTDLLSSATGQQVVMTGKREGIFLLSSPAHLPVDVNRIMLVAKFPVESFRFLGIKLRQPDMPIEIEMNRGRLRAVVAGELNAGKVLLQPQCDFGARRLELNIPASSQILKDVSLEQPLLDGVLGRIHPLFGALALPEGTIDLRMDNFSWPLKTKEPQPPVFKATIGMNKIRLKPAKILRDLFDLSGIDHTALRIKESEMSCENKGSRISCTPLHLLAGETEIGVNGSMGTDKTLAYHLQMPLTESLADEVHLPRQQGISVAAELTGTLDAPYLNQKAFLAVVSDQLGRAVAGKQEQPVPEESSEAKP